MLTTYIYDWTADAFVVLPSMPRGVPLQLSRAKKALALIDKGKWQASPVLQAVSLPTGQM